MNDQIDFLKRLIRAESPSGHEKKVADLVEKKLSELGYDKVTRDEYGNVLGTIGSGSPRIMLEGHMDNVEAGSRENWKMDPFCGESIDGKIYGRGSVDMKGPLSSMIYGASKAKEELSKGRGTVQMACVVHEETIEGAAIEKLIEKNTAPDLVILGEPSGLDICTGHRGRAVLDVSVFGQTSHASMPDLGENAALGMIDLINSQRKKALPADPELGKETMALINIACQPGEGPVIPDRAEAKLDFRIGRSTSEEDVIEFVKDEMDRLSLSGKVEIPTDTLSCYTGEELTSSNYFPAWYLDEEKLLNQVKSSLKHLSDCKVRTWNFSTDGVYTAGKAGIPTLGFGPGNEELAHQPNENIEIDELKTATECYLDLIKDLIK